MDLGRPNHYVDWEDLMTFDGQLDDFGGKSQLA